MFLPEFRDSTSCNLTKSAITQNLGKNPHFESSLRRGGRLEGWWERESSRHRVESSVIFLAEELIKIMCRVVITALCTRSGSDPDKVLSRRDFTSAKIFTKLSRQ